MLAPSAASLSVLTLVLAACAGPPPRAPQDDAFFAALRESRRPVWEPGQVLLQGFAGIGYPQDLSLQPNGGDPVVIDQQELDALPVIGGGGQLKLAGEDIDFGVEGMMSFAFRSDLQAFAAGGGGAVVVVDVDVLVFDLYGGPFLSKLLSDRVRVYGAAGPLAEFLEYDQHDGSGVDGQDGSGYGAGFYTRAGIEFLLPSGTLVGFGVRWSSADVDLGGDLGDFDFEGLQLLFTVSRRG